ncbi:hypothetical protein ACQ4LE_003804 [Meloidogyne hapla]
MHRPSTSGDITKKSDEERKMLRAERFGLKRHSSESEMIAPPSDRAGAMSPIIEHEFQQYDPDRFIRDARHYRSYKPPNLIQAASKLWMGSVFSVKILFLNYNLNIVSHDALRVFCYFAIESSSKISDKTGMGDKWKMAEIFHSYTYGSKYLNITTFDTNMAQVIQFIQTFKEINFAEVGKNLKSFLRNQNGFKIKQVDELDVMMGSTTYTYNKIIY